MKPNLKRIFVGATVFAMLAIFAGGCKKNASSSMCKKNDDCRVDATGNVIDGVCVRGKCEECMSDTDCSGLKQCIENRCESVCQADADCGPNSHCQENFCTADCYDDATCPGDRVCMRGRCLSAYEAEGMNHSFTESHCAGIEKIHFAFDNSEIKDEYLAQVEKLGKCLQEDPSRSVTIAGHCDERGTSKYNLALGERRANAVKDYLKMKLGVEDYRISTVSYGSERPLNYQKDESAYAENRRAEFNLQ